MMGLLLNGWIIRGTGNSPQFLLEDLENDFLFTAVRFGFRIIERGAPTRYFGLEEGIHSNDFIVAIGKDKEGKYWFGSDYGLSRFNLADKSFDNFTANSDPMTGSGIFTIYRDYKDNMWFGSRDGILTLDYESGKISRVVETEIKSRVSFIVDIEKHFLLIGTLEGLFLFNLKKYYEEGVAELKLYAQSNGFSGIQPIQNGAFKDSQGHIWIASRNGVTRLDPEKLNFEIAPLSTYFTKINNQKIGFYNNKERIDLPRNVNEVKIYFEAVGFSRPLKTQYCFRLAGQNTEWSDWQEEDYVLLTGLSSGKYALEVKSRTIGTIRDHIEAATLLFNLDLAFWKEPYFYQSALILIFVLTLLLAYYYYRQNMLSRRAKKNEQENRYLKVQSLQAQMNPHFIFNVLGTLQNLILKSNTWQANQHLVNLSILIRNFLDASVKSEIPKGIVTENEIALEKEIELIRMYIDFERLQYGDVFDYELTIDKKLENMHYTIPPMIIQPYVENAIKHGLLPKRGKGKLKVQFSEEDEIFRCIIEDNGIGRERAKEIRKKSLKPYQSPRY